MVKTRGVLNGLRKQGGGHPPPWTRTPPPTPAAVNVGQGMQYPPPLRLLVNGNASSREGCNDALVYRKDIQGLP